MQMPSPRGNLGLYKSRPAGLGSFAKPRGLVARGDVHAWNWLMHYGEGKKLRTYALFKRVIKYEPHLTDIKNRKHQMMMSKFRLSSHDLEIETGRYGRKPIKPAERHCKLCQALNISIMEDEFHLLMICPTYKSKRKIMPDTILQFIPKLKSIICKRTIHLVDEPRCCVHSRDRKIYYTMYEIMGNKNSIYY